MQQTFTPEQAKKQADKKAIRFIITLFLLYIFFSQGNLFMNSVFSAGGQYYNAYLAAHFNYIQGLRTSILIPSVWLIKLFGFYAIYNDSDILVVAGPHLSINYSCLGLGVMSFFAAFVKAFPAKVKSKLKKALT